MSENSKSAKRVPAWIPRPPVWGRLKRARAERDQARAALRRLRNELKSTQRDRDEVLGRLSAAQVEADHLRTSILQKQVEFSAQLETRTESLARELADIRKAQTSNSR